MKIRFVSDGPALLVTNAERILVVADLHIGIEADLAVHGWHVPSRSGKRLERLLASIDATDPGLVVFLGDVKHNLPVTTRQEHRELPEILTAVRKIVPLRVVPGNHDTGIGRFLHDGELMPADGAIIDGTGYIHGHTVPSPELFGNLILAGHHHPLVAIHDDVGCALRAPAYLLAGLDAVQLFGLKKKSGEPGKKPLNVFRTRALFLPAFNECAGFDVHSIVKHPFSPISRAIDEKSAEVFLTDGTFVGPVTRLGEP